MLQFSDTSTKNGIIQRIEFDTKMSGGGISDNPTLLAQFTAIINAACSKVTSLIITSDGTWSWDDTSHIDQAVATTNIAIDQNDYTILPNTPNASKDYLKTERVEIKDNAGNWVRLRRKDLRRWQSSISESRTNTGIPRYYDFNGTSIFLDAIPNYDSTGGLKIWFSRAQLNFVVGDTTKRPGFASLYHEYPVLKSVYHWEKYYDQGNPEQTKRDILEMEADIKKHYSTRDKTEPTVIRRPAKSYR